MRFNVLPWKPVLAALIVSLLWVAPAEAAGKTAVVDMVQIMRTHPRAKVLEGNFAQAQTDARAILEEEDKEIQKLKRELEASNEQSPDRASKEKHYQQRVANAQFNFEWAMKNAMRGYTLGLERMYGAVRGVIGRYAEEQGIDLVLYRTPPVQPLNAGDANDFALKTRLRAVVYASSSIDITDAITKRIADAAKKGG